MSKRVSILVPVYGVEKYIGRCAESLFSQSYPNIEYVFVDDQTLDSSIHILDTVLDSFPERKESVHIIHHEHHRGLAAARNTALDYATGEFVFWVDSDDWVEKDALKVLMDKQEKNDADIVFGWIRKKRKDGISTMLTPAYKTKDEMMTDIFRNHYNYFVWGRLMKRKIYEDHSIRCKEGVDYCEDMWHMFPVAYYADKIACVDQFVYCYNQSNEDSYSFIYKNHFRLDYLKQYQQSVIFVADFYRDKTEYNKLAHEFVAARLRTILLKAANQREKQYFEELKRLIYKDYSIYCNAIGQNNFFIRSVCFNYFLLRLLYRPAYFVKSVFAKFHL